jgi:hypothetical protein
MIASGDLIKECLRAAPMDHVMACLEQVAEFDRYQSSKGMEQAAAVVAETARTSGLKDVCIQHFPADGTKKWWSFQSPMSWTPRVAHLEIRANGRCVLEMDHAQQPFLLGTYSAPTPREGLTARLINVRNLQDVLKSSGAVAVIDRTKFTPAKLLPDLISAGAAGFITDAPCCGTKSQAEYRGRIELSPGAPLFAFSVTSHELDLIKAWADEDAAAFAAIEIDNSEFMPVVTGTFPGQQSQDEIWLMAHLCHPRPGANDNASGVAALAGVAAVLAELRQRAGRSGPGKTIRFLWGPEFLGPTAMLRQCWDRGRRRPPSAVINLDMVGENQNLCGGPFVLERSPDCHPALINPIAEHVLGEVFVHTNAGKDTWRPRPFHGFSDHALFAGPGIRCPAIQFCHVEDRFNHSSGDTLDKVSSSEMLRATAAAAAVAQILAHDATLSSPLIRRIVAEWCTRASAAAQGIATDYQSVEDGRWSTGLLQYVARRNASMVNLSNGQPPPDPYCLETSSEFPAILCNWSGPINLRAMMADLPVNKRLLVADLIRADKHNYALLMNFAIRADGRRTQMDIISETAFAVEKPIDPAIAEHLFSALIESGWVTETRGSPVPLS